MSHTRTTILTSLALAFATSTAFAQPAKPKPAAKKPADAVAQKATALEAELAKFKDTTPEAAGVMVKLIDLYHANGRVFGLVRIGQRFVAAHPRDKRHAAVMLKLIDGLEAASRNKELTANCRQFLVRYPKSKECAAVEVRLANTLEQMTDRVATADAHRAVFTRQPTTQTGQESAVKAIRIYAGINNRQSYFKAAEVALALFDRLPAGQAATDVGQQAVYQYQRGGDYAKSNLAGRKLLSKGLPRDAKAKRQLHRVMSDNFANLGQYTNSVNSLKQARALGDSQDLHYYHVYRLHQANAKPNEIEPLVNAYAQKYPQRQDRHYLRGLVAYAYQRNKNTAKAVEILKALLPYDAQNNNNAFNYVQYQPNAKAAAKHRQALQTLSSAESRVKTATARYEAAKKALDKKPADLNRKKAVTAAQAELAKAKDALTKAQSDKTAADKEYTAATMPIAQPLIDAIAKNDKHAHYLRYTLGYYIYRDRLRDTAKMRQTFRDLIAKSPSNDGHTSSPIQVLLSSAETEAEFKADVALIIKSAKNHLHIPTLRTAPVAWAKSARRKRDLRERAAYVQQQFKTLNASKLVTTWTQAVSYNRKAEAARAQWRKPAIVKAMSDAMAREMLSRQAYFYWHYVGNKQRQNSALLYAQLAKRFPKDYDAAVNYLHTATDYNKPEIKKEAALHVLTFDPPANHPDVWRRMLIAADSAKDTPLVKRVYAWIEASQKKHGLSPDYASTIGDYLLKHKMEAEAVAYWTRSIPLDRNHYESRECAARLIDRMVKPDPKDKTKNLPDYDKRIAFATELFKHDTDFHGRYASWLGYYYLAKNDLDSFEKTLKESRARQDKRLMRGWDFDEYTAQNWINAYRNDKDKPDAEKIRVFTLIRDLRIPRSSATAKLALLEVAPPKSEIERLLAYQSATRMVYDASHDWDRLMPHVQAAMARKDFAASATLLTGMLANIPNAETGRKKTGRELVAQSYSRMGAVGLTFDESSPIAPLLQAALYLRLGDRRLALETYAANKALFDKHRNQVPVDLLLFVCESRVAAGGDKNHEYVEDVLRGWMVKNSESKSIDEATKARIQLMLARNFFKARRYDVARSEFTTVINRYPKTKEATEARFGIGETFMAQKVYDQAEAVFDKLAQSREADTIVRAEFLRGVLTYRRGDKDKAREIFRGVLERVPNVELANQALFNLAEVYGSEERYIDQLTLLQTVGRLGRSSKRRHRPGMPLSIVVQDSDLGISRGHNKIPVRVTTVPGGDSELIYLTSGGAGKGLFRTDLETRLGKATKDDGVLQLTGKDVIKCDYPEKFKKEFKHVSLSDVEIRVAADAEFKIASSKIVEQKEESFSERLRKQAAKKQNADQRVSQVRPANQVKPGNVVYLQVKDADRDLTDSPDTVVVKLVADSGDEVQVTLTETGPHTGIFEGTAKTGELPAGALAGDTAIGHSPLMAIDRDPKSYWSSEPDGQTPKVLTIDMKDLKKVARVKLTTPQAFQNAPVRGDLLGSNDGRLWFRIASNPPLPTIAPAGRDEVGRMSARVFAGNYARYTTWNQIAQLGKTRKTFAEIPNVETLSWTRPENEEKKKGYAVLWRGKLVQERAGAARIQVRGVRTALALNGKLELPVGGGNRSVDLWLEAGTHELTIFAAASGNTEELSASIARSNHSAAQLVLAPFRKSDFDLTQPAASKPAKTQAAQVVVDDGVWSMQAQGSWEFGFNPVDLRYVRLVVKEYLGEAVAISHVEVTGEKPTDRYIPTEADVLSLAKNKVLEIAGGDVVTATYADEKTQSDAGRSRLLTAKLTATYFNGGVTPIAFDLSKNANGAVEETRKVLMRIEPGERVIFEITDYDQDRTGKRDTIQFQVVVNDGKPITLTATETEEYTGIFTKEVDTSAKTQAGKLTVKPGDKIYCRYLDEQNTFPGHAVPREAVVFVNTPSVAKIRLYESRVIPPPEGSTARPRYQFHPPKADQKTSRVSLEAPLTVEVIDPDAAKDSLSTVRVTLLTTEGVKVEVECKISGAFANRPQAAGDNWPLREGRFVGQVILQLGGKNSPQLVPLTLNMPRNLIGGPVLPEEDDNGGGFGRSLVTRVLNVTGKDRMNAVYIDKRRPVGPAKNISATGRLITNGKLAGTDRDYDKPVTQLHVGENLYLMVNDADRDASDKRDSVTVIVSTPRGEKETVELKETLAHSGVFVGMFKLKPNEKPTPGNLDKENPAIETYFGDKVELKYLDPAAGTADSKLEVTASIPVVIGTDGLVSAFSKTFNDEKLAVETKFTIAESYFELFKSHKKLGRKSEQQTDLKAGRRVLKELMQDYPSPKYVPRIAYLAGQFAQELGQWSEAIESYEMIIRQYGEHQLAPDAQYKLAQCYEESGDFDQALEGYVTLAATYPKSPLIADVMLRISDHFFKAKKYVVAAQVGEKFLERFETHKYAAKMAFLTGQCYFKDENYKQAAVAFDKFAEKFPKHELTGYAFFWSGESFRLAKRNREAFQRFNNCRWKFPASEAAKYARGRLALPEMIRQFEAEARSVDDNN